MKAELVNPFLAAAVKALARETGAPVGRGELTVLDTPLLTEDVAVLIGVVGNPRGLVTYGMSADTGCRLVGFMIGNQLPTAVSSLDSLAISGLAELGNVITGLATVQLEAYGYQCDIVPPTVLVGKGTYISTLNIRRLSIGLQTAAGPLSVCVALRESS